MEITSTTFTGRSTLARTNQGQCSFDVFEGASDFGDVIKVGS